MSIFTGSGVALITPFDDKGDINYVKLDELIQFHLDNLTDALIVAGTTGEASTLTDEEQVNLVEFTVKKVEGKIPVIAGAGSNDTRHGINLAKMCENVGADALLQVTPYYNKTTQYGLLKHFEAINDNVNIPMILYSVPGRTGMGINPDTVKRISEMDNFVGIKDATGDISYTTEIINIVDNDFYVYSGNDDIVLPMLSIGAKGVISVWANIYPKVVHDMCELFFDGRMEEARYIQLKYKKFIDVLFSEVNPIPIKAAMNIAKFDVGGLRLPLVEAQPDTIKKIRSLMEEFY